MVRAVILGNRPEAIERVYAQGRRERVAELAELYPHVVGQENLREHLPALREVEVAFGTWGFPPLGAEDLDALPALRAVFYGAGSVQAFARPFLERGITVVSAWAANAVPVAEFCLAQILLATKGYFVNTRQLSGPDKWRGGYRGPGNYGETVSLIGLGMISQTLIELLRPIHLKVLVVSNHLNREGAEELGVRKVTMEEAFREGLVVSNHLANLPHTQGVLHRGLFGAMRPYATFINTGRGAQVVEEDLIRVLRERPDLTALLDVTHPEPPVASSPLYTLPNVHLSSHIAGSIGDEVVRMADYVIEEFEGWLEGRPLRYAVTMEMLERMA